MARPRKLWPVHCDSCLVTGTEKNWAELGRQVKLRREQQGLGQGDLGPSDLTVRKLEQGVGKDLRVKTLTQIERSLGWRDGTCEKILTGTAAPEDLTAVIFRSGVTDAEPAHHVRSVHDSINTQDSVSPTVVLVSDLVGRLAREENRSPAADGALDALYRLLPELFGPATREAQQIASDELARRDGPDGPT